MRIPLPEGAGTIKIVLSDILPYNSDENVEIVLECSVNYGAGIIKVWDFVSSGMLK